MNDHADELDDKHDDEMQDFDDDFDETEEDKENIQAKKHICSKDIIIKKVLYLANIYEFEFYVYHSPKLTIFFFGKTYLYKLYSSTNRRKF